MNSDICWFPLRVTYNREMKVKENFDRIGMECFLPMCRRLEGQGNLSHGELVPAIHNLLFVHSSRNEITRLKMYDKNFSALRYIMRKDGDKFDVITIRDKEMENFIRVASVTDSSVFFLDHERASSCIGKKVRITAGRFQGVVGVIRRIKRNRHVVVQIDGIAAVAITYIPFEFVEEVTE